MRDINGSTFAKLGEGRWHVSIYLQICARIIRNNNISKKNYNSSCVTTSTSTAVITTVGSGTMRD